MRALNRKLVRDLRGQAGPIVAIGLVLATGIAMVVMSQSLVVSLRESRDRYYARDRLADVFVQARRAPEHVAARLRAVDGVAVVETRVVAMARLDPDEDGSPRLARIASLPEGPPALDVVRARRGRMPRAGSAAEALVGEAFSEAAGVGPGDRLGVVVRGRRLDLEIVGVASSPAHVYSIAPGQLFPDDRRFAVLWMGRGPLAAALDLEGAFNDASVLLAPGAREQDVIPRLDVVLERHGGLGAHGRADHSSAFFVDDELEQLRTMSLTAPPAFLAVAAFLVHVVLSRLVGTQREQIAALKAFGYAGSAVAWHYLGFVLAVLALALPLGTAAGIALAADALRQYARFYRFPETSLVVPPSAVVAAAAIACAAGVLGALSAVRRASALPPAEAMRPEAPPAFRRTLLEVLGLSRLVTPVTRMVLRDLERRWLRSSLTVLGLSLAVGLLVVSPSIVDSVDAIVVTHLARAQRQDLSVAFADPRTARARHELARLPGVLRVEGHRSASVRLRSGPRSERVALTGLERSARLWRVLDREGHAVEPPSRGVLLGTALADALGARPGDRLRVEVLEGRRARAEVTVAGTFEEDVGMSAVMSLDALCDLLGEGDVISGAHLAVDPAAAGLVHRALAARPGVTVVSSREAAIASFRETLDASMVRMTAFNVLFGSIIACGVVYNSARIALAQRSRELASLRVLGFHRSEVSAILVGEQAILTAAAIPLGWVVGYLMTAGTCALLTTRLYRVPLVAEPSTYAWAAIVVIAAALASALVVRRRVDRLDLLAVLKARD